MTCTINGVPAHFQPPAPTLYDGLNSATCYAQWCDNRSCAERGGQPMYSMTESQIAEGKRIYRSDLVAHWSAELRARITAAKERDRLQVCCEMQDEP